MNSGNASAILAIPDAVARPTNTAADVAGRAQALSPDEQDKLADAMRMWLQVRDHYRREPLPMMDKDDAALGAQSVGDIFGRRNVLVSDILLAIADLPHEQLLAVHDALGQHLHEVYIQRRRALFEEYEPPSIVGKPDASAPSGRRVLVRRPRLLQPHPLAHLTAPPDYREAMVAED